MSVNTTNALLGNPVVKDLLICTLCSRFFDDPRVLPCQHTFCLNCLQKQFQTSHASSRVRLSSMRCPSCFSAAAIPIRGINSFPSDTKVEKIKELVEGAMMTGILKKSRIDHLEGRSRAGSKSRPNSWTGNIDVLAGHGIDDLNNSFSGALGEINAENIVPRHKHTKEISTDTNDDWPIENYNHDAMKNDNVNGNFTTQECGIQTDISGDLKSICDEKLSKYEQYSHDDISDNMDGGIARKRSSDVKLNQNGVSRTKRSCPEIVKDQSVVDMDMDATNGNSDIQNGNCETMPDKKTINNVSDSNENDEQDGVEPANGDYEAHNTSIELPAVYTNEVKMLWSVQKEDYDMPTAVAMTSNENIIISEYGNCKLQFYEKSGHYIQSVDEVKPFALAVTKDDKIVVSDRKDKTVKVYDTLGELSYKWDDNCFHWISGIDVTSQGNFVVFDREDCKIGIFSPEGDRIHQFGHYGDGDSHLCMADFLTVDAHDRILVCDSGHHCIKIYDTNGTFLGRFGERGTSEGYLLWPKSVCVDAGNNILVTDQRNNRINVYSPDGHFIQTLLKTTNSPFNTGFLEPDKVAVTHFDLSGYSEISVFQL